MLKNLISRNKQACKKLYLLNTRNFRPTQSLHKSFEVYIDDKPITVDSSYTIFQACTEAGVTIPRFWYHERLAIAGNWRMCLVEVEKSPKPVASCAMNVMPNMKINTQSERTRIARGGVMEFLLANHPLDCPICDQGGECDLQDISQVYGYREGRFNEYKRAVEDKYLGPLIRTVMNRCIHCTRCIRFTEQIGGEHTLGTTGRGEHTEIGTYIANLVTNELSANAVDLCPVGALTHMPYTFIARPWELKTTYSIDILDGLGSNIEVNNRGGEVMRILPRVNEDVNQEWISDKSRHAFDGLKKQRLSFPIRRTQDGEIKELRWEEAIIALVKEFDKVTGKEIAGVIGPHVDVETACTFRDLMMRLGWENIEASTTAPKLSANLRSNYLFNSRITGVEDADFILFVGCNPRSEAPVLNARIRQWVEDHGLEVGVIGYAPELNYEYNHYGTSPKILEEILSTDHLVYKKLCEAELPMIVTSSHVLSRQDGDAIFNTLKMIAEKTNVLNSDNSWNGLNILHNEASKTGAMDLGIQQYQGNDSIKNAKLIYLLGADDFREEDIPENAFVVYQGHMGDKGAHFADLVLPGASYLEKHGSYVNTDGRVQIARKVIGPPALAREDWAILRALSEELGQALPYDNEDQIRDRIVELAPHLLKFDGLEPSNFGELAIQHKSGNTKMSEVPFNDPIDNFYMTDAISRQSSVMAKCSKEFNPKKLKNFKDPDIDFAGR